jgi:hypothetical protein
MINIPNSFKETHEDYITIPILKKFCSSHGISTTDIRHNLIEEILNYSNKSKTNEDEVKYWLDEILKEGIKHIYLTRIYTYDNFIKLKTKNNCEEFLKKTFADCPQNFLVTCKSIDELKLQSYLMTYDENVVKNISFIFTINLLEGYAGMQGNKIIYPIFIDVDLENGYIIGRGKSKARLFKVSSDKTNLIYETNRINVDILVKEAIESIKNSLSIVFDDKNKSESFFKKTLYTTFSELTFTPEVIQKQIDSRNNDIDDFINDIFPKIKVNIDKNFDKAKSDLETFIEKYISINYHDRDVFTEDRIAYPFKLISVDSEFTKIEETTSNKEPLQCKERFFDNKKSIEYEKTCDGFALFHKRLNTKYFGKTPFVVKMTIKQGYCIIRFEKYVEEEDINNVLSRIIENGKL